MVLTDIGESYASTPVNNPSLNQRILYFMRRHGKKATDEQLAEFVSQDKNEIAKAVNTLARNRAIRIIGR